MKITMIYCPKHAFLLYLISIFIIPLSISFNVYGTIIFSNNQLTLDISESNISSSSNLVIKKSNIWGESNTCEFGYDVIVDGNNNAYITGTSNLDVILQKYDSSGELEWAKTWFPSDNLLLYGKTVGICRNTSIFVSGVLSFPYRSQNDRILLIKYDLNGEIIWNSTWASTRHQSIEVIEIKLDSSGDIYLLCTASIGYQVDGGDILLLKFDSAGHLIWRADWDYYQHDRASGLAIDNSDNIYITGESMNSYTNPLNELFLLTVTKQGNLVSTKFWKGTSQNEGEAIVFDGNGCLYIAGKSHDEGYPYPFVLKYDLQEDWLLFGKIGSEYEFYPVDIALDNYNRVYVLGMDYETSDETFHPELGLLIFDENGELALYERWAGGDSTTPRELLIDETGSILIVGDVWESGGEQGNIVSYSNPDLFYVKYQWDTDGDGIPDIDELNLGTDPLNPFSNLLVRLYSIYAIVGIIIGLVFYVHYKKKKANNVITKSINGDKTIESCPLCGNRLEGNSHHCPFCGKAKEELTNE